jgi:hypothetical protein
MAGSEFGCGQSGHNDLAMCEFEDSQFQPNDMGLFDMGDEGQGNNFY